MKTFSRLVFLMSLFWCGGVMAESLEEFGDKMSNFYLSPTQEAFVTFQKSANRFSGDISARGNGADILVSVMIARISKRFTWPISDGAFSGKANEILDGNSDFAKFVSDDSRVDAPKFDVWWASFFATGDEQYLESIFKYAGLELPKGNFEKMMAIGSAKWSFKANCRQHKRVLDFAKKKLQSKPTLESQTKFLNDCIAFAEPNRAEQIPPSVWRNVDGKPVPETESMKSKNDFAGSVLATTDEDWEKKWNTPPETKPNFNRADVISYGKRIFILTFFSNPMTDGAGDANVRCDLKIIAPTGNVSLEKKDMTCFSGHIAGIPYNLRLSAPVIGFSGDPGDPAGTWSVEVNLRDAIRNVELPLRTSFQLE